MLQIVKLKFRLPEKILILLRSMQAKDISLYYHALNTAEISLSLNKHTNIEHSFSEYDIYISGLLHDVGKLYISNDILLKQSDLTNREKELIRSHPIYGSEMLKSANKLRKYAKVIEHHHEKDDGGGYPYGLKVNDIHPVARIIREADRLAALIEYRPYRHPYPLDYALHMMRESLKAITNGKYDILIKDLAETLKRKQVL